ncbi:uncharacterized protein C8A04DRAFT_25911 [Dichotomopilus funicola]|uniref:RRM domain-containing protein n=1 Tax=Dichotomopilus funicola TaxID=1934379 RepID=A0AAN6VA75_9PEZI|nr:hypothetical protein C8A04DRAFT_25911 [Dichotomopilus funicola]
MSSSSSTAVTVDRDYFDTLVRRARFNTESRKTGAHNSSVVIPRAEYDNLILISKQYANLRRNLFRGGVDADTVNILSQDDETIRQSGSSARVKQQVNKNSNEGGGAPLYTNASTPGGGRGHIHGGVSLRSSNSPHYERAGYGGDDGDEEDDSDDETDENGSSDLDSPIDGNPGTDDVQPQESRTRYERACLRTLQLSGLADGTTHVEITNAVRGGVLLDIWVRHHDRSAAVSFVRSEDAKGFYDHVRRHDLYIRNKRVEVKWSDRQFVLPDHVANKIGNGASRNLVIHGCDGRHKEDVIREDLDHIHNLVVVKIGFVSGNCHIGLNSIHNAIYARQCMMSRLRYKGKKIAYAADECAQPYHQAAVAKPRDSVTTASKKTGLRGVSNRFQLLNLDDTVDEEIAATLQGNQALEIAV